MRLIKEKGVTIVEIVVAIGVLGIVSMGLIGFFTDSFKFQARSQESSRAQKVAEEIFEELNDTKQYDGIELSTLVEKSYDIPVEGKYIGELKVNKIDGNFKEGLKYDVTIKVTSQGQNKMTGEVNSTIEIAGTLGDETNITIVYNLPYGEWIYGNNYPVKYDIKRGESIKLLTLIPTCAIETVGDFVDWSSDKDNFNQIKEISENDFKDSDTYSKIVYAFWECDCPDCGNEYFNNNICSEYWCYECDNCINHCDWCYICDNKVCECEWCDECGNKVCECEWCDECGNNVCECECCSDCGQYPCECCSDCGQYPCECCSDCGQYPCECEEEGDAGGIGGGTSNNVCPCCNIVVATPGYCGSCCNAFISGEDHCLNCCEGHDCSNCSGGIVYCNERTTQGSLCSDCFFEYLQLFQ